MTENLAVRFHAYGRPEVLILEPVPRPVPAAGEVLVEMHAGSVNPVDWKIRAGHLRNVLPMRFPAVTGRDGAGVVAACGPGVSTDLAGARVCFLTPRGAGTWAQFIAVPVDLVSVVPQGVPLAEAAALPLAGLSAVALIETAPVSSGMRVLVHAAAGGVGHLAVQIARHLGAEVIATCSERNAAFVRSVGAQHVIAYDRAPFETAVSDVDVVLDLIGGEVHRRSYAVLRRGGSMVCLAAEPFEDRGAAHGVTVKTARVAPDRAALDRLLGQAAEGSVRIAVEQVFPLRDFAQAQASSESGHARGKTVLMLR